jgi:restriction system protein
MGRRKRARRNQLFEKGILTLVTGCALLTLPMFLKGSPLLQPVVQGLKTPGWITLALGAALLLADRISKFYTRDASGPPDIHRAHDVLPGSADMFAPEPAPPPGKPHLLAERPVPSSARGTRSVKRPNWDSHVFDDIEWRRFEAVCERLFAQAGFRTQSQSHGADGGVDIWLYSKHAAGPAAVVQCKHWVGKPVGVKEVREFFGVMTSNALKRGTFATSSTFTPAAVEFAKSNGINMLDGTALLAQITRRSPEQQQELLAIAYEGDYWRPTCASCGVKLVERITAKGGAQFWGCPNFPRCRTRIPARAA